MLSYDIWCSLRVNLRRRFEKLFPKSAHIIDRMRGAIPKMHIKNHIEACQQLWAFNYLQYSGETYGEMIETTWAENNQAGGSTKEMNAGHRHDTIAHLANFWNYVKESKLGEYETRYDFPAQITHPSLCASSDKSLLRAYIKNVGVLMEREVKFDAYTRTIEEKVSEWVKIDTQPFTNDNGKVISPYEVSSKNRASLFNCSTVIWVSQHNEGPPTQKRAYEKFVEEEKSNELAGKAYLAGVSQFINSGLNIEKDQ